MDLSDLEHNVRDGVHMASLAGAWIAAVAGFGGMRDHDGELAFGPRLPAALGRLAFRMSYRGRLLRVDVDHDRAEYALLAGSPLDVGHHGERLRLEAGRPVTREIPPIVAPPPPRQPPGRAPSRRGAA
jgi:alpha,alpha-trehalose phosphorylase